MRRETPPPSGDLELVRELIALGAPARAGTLEQRRAHYDRAAEEFAVPPGVTVTGRVGDGWSGEHIRPHEADPRAVLLYLHGGAYTLGSARSHRHLAAALGAAAARQVVVLDYRRPPEDPFPAALDDAVACVRELHDAGHTVAVAGDSAGGGLALALALALADGAGPPLAGVACLSPWTDLTCSAASHVDRAHLDPLLDPANLRVMGRTYAGAADVRDPLVSPAFAPDLAGLPPLFVQVGSAEVLLDDARDLVRRARAAGVDVVGELWEPMIHVWQWYAPVLAEGRAALGRLAEFLARVTAPDPLGAAR